MLQYFARLKKGKNTTTTTTTMAEEPSTPGPNQPLTNEEIQAAAAETPTPIPTTPLGTDQTGLFMEAYDCAKNNHNWNKVSIAISNHPEWLTRIPQGRRWTMLHQVVYCGNVSRLNEVLGYQLTNQEFRLLCKALDDKTVREVASERAHVYPQMLRRIERLVAIDQLLNNAKDSKWELVKQFLRQQPDIVNEKPPYRKYYLAHYLALTGQLDKFIELSNICEFKLDLIADDKTINQLARDNNHIEFAEHIEQLQLTANESNENNHQDDEPVTPTESNLPYPTTQQPFFSQGFNDDPGITIFSINQTPLGNLLLLPDETLGFPTHHQSFNDLHYATHSLFQGQNPTTMTMIAANSYHQEEEEKKSKSLGPPPMTDEEQEEYEKTVMDNIKKFSADNLLNAVTCCITKGILRDPVVAADGFTYEREAILNWFVNSNRSPMTNQELDNQELKPNHAIKSILQSLAEPNKNEKSKTNGDKEK